MDPLLETFQAHIRQLLNTRAARLEQAVEQAIQGGEHGVLIDTDGHPHVSPHVPYGQIHQLPRKL